MVRILEVREKAIIDRAIIASVGKFGPGNTFILIRG